MYFSWETDSSTSKDAKTKSEELKNIYLQNGFGLWCDVVKSNHTYKEGFAGEAEFKRFLEKHGIDHAYLNTSLTNEAKPDKGDFLVLGKLVNLKTQVFHSGEPKPNWCVNVNLKDYQDDLNKGIEQYHFLLHSPDQERIYYVGYIEYDMVPLLGILRYKDEQLTPWLKVQQDMYTIRLEDLKPLIPWDFQ